MLRSSELGNIIRQFAPQGASIDTTATTGKWPPFLTAQGP